jgi:UDP-N-acetylenolpyruvoylglucosamine reductase
MEIKGIQLLAETDKHWIIESGAGEAWHDLVTWTVQHGYAGLENMALIPGTVGGSAGAKHRCLWFGIARPFLGIGCCQFEHRRNQHHERCANANLLIAIPSSKKMREKIPSNG